MSTVRLVAGAVTVWPVDARALIAAAGPDELADALVDVVARAVELSIADAPAAVAALDLGVVLRLLEAADPGREWPVQRLAMAHEVVRARVERQVQVDRSVGGRRWGGCR